MPRPSATLTVWTSAWLHGSAAPDDVLDALQTWAELHEVVAADPATAERTGLPAPGERPGSVVSLLAAARRLGASAGRLLLPVPGDLRGMPPGPLPGAALRAGEAALLVAGPGGTDLAAVPDAVAESVLRWTVHAPGPLPPAQEAGLADAEHGLRGSVRKAASTLVDLDVARHRPGVRAEITEALQRRVRPGWPDGVPPRVLRVLEQADEVEAILRAAAVDAPGGALSASAADARKSALDPLATAVREARRAAVAEAVRALTTRADRH